MTREYSYDDDTKKRFDDRGNSFINKFSPKTIMGLFGGKQKNQIANGDSGNRSVGKNKKEPLFSTVSSGKLVPIRKGDTVADVTAKLYNLLKSSYDRKVKSREIESIFQEHAEREKERRHQELLKVLGGYKIDDKKTPTKEQPSGSGLGDLLGKGVDLAKDVVKNVGGRALARFLPIITNPTVLAAMAVGIVGGAPFLMDENGRKESPNETGDYKLTKAISEMTPYERFFGRVGSKRESIEDMIKASIDNKTPVFTEEEANDIKKYYEIDVPQETIGEKKRIQLPEGYQPVAKPEIGKALKKELFGEPGAPTPTDSIAAEVPVVEQLATPTPNSDRVRQGTDNLRDFELEGLSGGIDTHSSSRTNVVAQGSKFAGTVAGSPVVRNPDETLKKAVRGSTHKT